MAAMDESGALSFMVLSFVSFSIMSRLRKVLTVTLTDRLQDRAVLYCHRRIAHLQGQGQLLLL